MISAAAAAAGRLAAGGYVVIYDGVVGPWFVDVFGRAAGVTQLHYAVLLPATRVCVRRVESRVGHSFTNVDAARHMHAEFVAATLNSPHVIAKNGDATEIATDVRQLVRGGLILRSIEPSTSCPG